MNPRRSSRAPRANKRSRSVFPKWLLVLSCAAALIALNLVLFHRQLLVAFSKTGAPNSASETGRSNQVNAADSSTPTVVTDSDREKAMGLFTEGTELLAQKKFSEAAAAFQASLKLDPEAEDTHYNLAFALSKLGRADDAIREYEATLRILPDYAEAHNNLGNLLKSQGKLEEAIAHFNAALKSMPDHASAHNNLGVALAQQGKINEATLHFAKAAALQPNYPDAHYNLGSAYMSQGRVDEAAGEFNRALRLKPDFQAAAQALMKAEQTRALQRAGAAKP